jgi:hypothetical protein
VNVAVIVNIMDRGYREMSSGKTEMKKDSWTEGHGKVLGETPRAVTLETRTRYVESTGVRPQARSNDAKGLEWLGRR